MGDMVSGHGFRARYRRNNGIYACILLGSYFPYPQFFVQSGPKGDNERIGCTFHLVGER